MVLLVVLSAAALSSCADPHEPGRASRGQPDAQLSPEGPARSEHEPSWSPEALPLRRITAPQYLRALQQAFSLELRLTRPLPQDLIVDRSTSLGASAASLSPREVELYEAAAFEAAEGAIAHPDRARWLPCTLEVEEAECVADALSLLGERLWRRPLSAEERARLWDYFARALAALNSWEEALSYPVVSLLSSPYFLFRSEGLRGGEEDESSQDSSSPPLSDSALASRLSFFLWDAPPDETLLSAARRGALRGRAGWQREVERLLEAPEAAQGIERFFSDLFSLDELDALHTRKDPERFVHLSAELGSSARQEALESIVEELWVRERPVGAIFTSRERALDRRLAALYEVPAPRREGFGWLTLPPGPRVGFFGSVAFLALQAHPTSSSATLRGLFIQDRLLCNPPPPPPSGVDTSIPEPDPTRPTLRDRLSVHLSEPTCGGCHRAMDLVGLAFENFDAIGRYRAEERGHEIDPSGQLDGSPFAGPEGLAELVAEHPRLGPCLSERLLQHALGRTLEEGEEEGLPWLTERFEAGGRRWAPLLRAIVESEAFHGPYAGDAGDAGDADHTDDADGTDADSVDTGAAGGSER